MERGKWLLLILSAFMLVFAGCGEDKTSYEGDTGSSTTSQTPETGQSLFISSCQTNGCHPNAASLANTSATVIRAKNMAPGLTDAQLQKIVDYLATHGTTTPTGNGETLYKATCQKCHTTAFIAGTTVNAIKSSGMSYSLTDAQLQSIVDYAKSK